jgi:hypothetical protein
MRKILAIAAASAIFATSVAAQKREKQEPVPYPPPFQTTPYEPSPAEPDATGSAIDTSPEAGLTGRASMTLRDLLDAPDEYAMGVVHTLEGARVMGTERESGTARYFVDMKEPRTGADTSRYAKVPFRVSSDRLRVMLEATPELKLAPARVRFELKAGYYQTVADVVSIEWTATDGRAVRRFP